MLDGCSVEIRSRMGGPMFVVRCLAFIKIWAYASYTRFALRVLWLESRQHCSGTTREA